MVDLDLDLIMRSVLGFFVGWVLQDFVEGIALGDRNCGSSSWTEHSVYDRPVWKIFLGLKETHFFQVACFSPSKLILG